ncbi:MAG: ABC transporter permease, partial [Woeseia sp.]
MAPGYEFWVGTRYVRSRSSNGFVSLISAISMLGIAIAVAVLIVVLSVVNGFERELRERLLAMSAHATIEDPRGSLADWPLALRQAVDSPEVVAAAPYIEGQALLVHGQRLSGAELRGIDPELEDGVSGIAGHIVSGELSSLVAGRFSIVLGVELAAELGAGQGDKV